MNKELALVLAHVGVFITTIWIVYSLWVLGRQPDMESIKSVFYLHAAVAVGIYGASLRLLYIAKFKDDEKDNDSDEKPNKK